MKPGKDFKQHKLILFGIHAGHISQNKAVLQCQLLPDFLSDLGPEAEFFCFNGICYYAKLAGLENPIGIEKFSGFLGTGPEVSGIFGNSVWKTRGP